MKEREPDAQSCSASQQVVVAAMNNKYTAKCADGREVGVIAMIANGMCTATRLRSSTLATVASLDWNVTNVTHACAAESRAERQRKDARLKRLQRLLFGFYAYVRRLTRSTARCPTHRPPPPPRQASKQASKQGTNDTVRHMYAVAVSVAGSLAPCPARYNCTMYVAQKRVNFLKHNLIVDKILL